MTKLEDLRDLSAKDEIKTTPYSGNGLELIFVEPKHGLINKIQRIEDEMKQVKELAIAVCFHDVDGSPGERFLATKDVQQFFSDDNNHSLNGWRNKLIGAVGEFIKELGDEGNEETTSPVPDSGDTDPTSG